MWSFALKTPKRSEGSLNMTIADVLRKEGIEKGKEETAVNLYKMGLTLDQIAKGTGIDKEKLKEILKDVER
jgi:predicted transposase/invertase (TIGR01784 family)